MADAEAQSLPAIAGGQAAIPEGPPEWPLADPQVRDILMTAWHDGQWGRYEAEYVPQLMDALARLHDVPYVYPCCSGTIAVELALRGLRLGPGDEVLLAGYDFPGNFRAIEAVGARPVLVDIDPDRWSLDAGQASQAIGPATKAILVSHLHSGLADMAQLIDLASRHGLFVVEDACQAPGAVVQGRAAGSWGDAAAVSFGGSKLLSAGRGGAVLTAHEHVYQRVKVFAERGNEAFPLSQMQAAVLLPQIAKLADRNARRRANGRRLLDQSADLGALAPLSVDEPAGQPSYYKLAWRYRPELCGGMPRDAMLAALQAEGLAVGEGFRGFARRSTRRCRHAGTLHQSAIVAEQAVLLHHPVLLQDPAVIDNVAKALHKVVRYYSAQQ